MTGELKTFKDLAEEIKGLKSKSLQKIIAIEGGGGAGKSTFANRLQSEIQNSEIIHIDDFYVGPWDRRVDSTDYEVHPFFEWDRFATEVIQPIMQDKQVAYYINNWDERYSERIPVKIPQESLIIVEGVYLSQERFKDAYDYLIWIEVNETERLSRAIKRDGEDKRFLWEEDWLPLERNYARHQNPRSRADLIVDGLTCDYKKGTYLSIRD